MTAGDLSRPVGPATAGVVIPAHNEARVIGRLLSALLVCALPGEFEVVVVCNGCDDDTAAVAREFGLGTNAVTVLETGIPSKQAAMRLGDANSRVYPRVYLDADVLLGAPDIRALCAAVAVDGVLAAAPRRRLDSTGAAPLVRWFYDVWQELPQVRSGLFGRGAIALSRAGHERVTSLPAVLSDDLAVSEAFAPDERALAGNAEVTVRTPRTVQDLLRRRIRVATGNIQLDDAHLRSSAAQTTPGVLLAMLRRRPLLTPQVLVFVAVTFVARVGARRRVAAGDYTTWLRDESSRAGH